MSFKLTYATMFDPPAELHASFDSAVARALVKLGGRHALHIAGAERGAAQYFVKTNPADCQQVLGEFPAAGAGGGAGDRGFFQSVCRSVRAPRRLRSAATGRSAEHARFAQSQCAETLR